MNGQNPGPDAQGFRRRLLAMAGEPVDLATFRSAHPAPDRSVIDG
jgi:hypothetical protein